MNCAVAVAQLVRHRRINFVLRISDVAEEILSAGCAGVASESILVYAYILM